MQTKAARNIDVGRDRRIAVSDHLSSYFRDLSEHELLTPDQECEMAQAIEQHETDAWVHLLGHPSASDYLVEFTQRRLGEPITEFDDLRRATAEARKSRAKSTKTRLAQAAQNAAMAIRKQDLDRVHIEAVIDHVAELQDSRRGFKLSFFPRSQSFTACCQLSRQELRVAARIRDEFVHSNLRLVVTMARRYDRGGMQLADLIQEGNLGLMHAVSRFDYRRGLRFSTYACWWIRHAIGRALADKSRTVRIPVHMLEAQQRLHKVRHQLTRELGRNPTTKELSSASRLSEAKLRQMSRFLMGQSMSLDKPLGHGDDRAYGDLFADPDSEQRVPEEDLTNKELAERVHGLLGDLSPIEADVIRLRFGLTDDNALTFREIGAQYQLSRERIRQIQNAALSKLRAALEPFLKANHDIVGDGELPADKRNDAALAVGAA